MTINRLISEFTFIYPVLMAYVWMGGTLIFLLAREVFEPSRADIPVREHYPRVAFLVPCYNEEDHIEETLGYLEAQTYPNVEIVAVNDGSSDGTGDVLDHCAQKLSRVRSIQLVRNQGKATALRVAHAATDAEYVIVVDSDVVVEPDVAARMVYRLERNPRVGAVTGNPRIRNRGSLLTRIQTGEFSSVVGLIKRAESAYGRLFSVSGCIAAFRHAAVQEVGYWGTDMATEDVDVTWRLQLGGWLVEYEPAAICWVLMPETLGGLWKQRLRWAQGGSEVLLRHCPHMFRTTSLWMWPIYIEYMLSILWALLITVTIGVGVVGLVLPLPSALQLLSAWSAPKTIVLVLTFLLQSAFALLIDRRYEEGLSRQIFWMIWYPIGYWLITASTAVVGFGKALGQSRGTSATWERPDRGVMYE
jgi:biofilm PGA synthesis N-glycosyltransferase PgaC